MIAGVSTRAFAESAWRAGFRCETVDAFGDLDQKARVRNLSFHRDLGPPYSARAAAVASRQLSAGAAAYVGNLENHPTAVRRLAEGRVLLGNTPNVLARARDPFLLAEVVATVGARAPLAHRPRDARRADAGRGWLRKPMRGGGGSGVRAWRPGEPLHPHEIVQEYVDGVAASVVFLADGRQAELLGLSRQLIEDCNGGRGRWEMGEGRGYGGSESGVGRGNGGSESGEGGSSVRRGEGTASQVAGIFAAPAFRYAGSLYPLASPGTESPLDVASYSSLEDRAAAVATAVTAAFRLRGVNGLDFVLRDGELFVLELNPRYPASAELIERATGLSIFEAHAAACLGQITVASRLPAVAGSTQLQTVWGKAILYARDDVIAGDTCSWLDDDAVRDIPFPGERIPRGHPVCTIFACGVDHADCYARLVAKTHILWSRRLVRPSMARLLR